MSLLVENRGSVYAGSPYPDYLYECGPNHDNGEYTHWAPFQAIAAKYIREAYPAPRNASGDALVAFMAGVVSHYMADISWHGLAETPGGYGLIEHIGAMDYNGTGGLDSAPHTECDTAAEFVAVYENSVPWDDPTSWVIPTSDLLKIYALANRSDVQASSIEECAAIFFAGAEAVRAAAALAEPLLAAASPTLDEVFSDLLVGGSDDMAVMLGRMWGRWGTWVENGPPSPVPGHEYCNQQNPCEDPPSGAPHHRAPLRQMQNLYRTLGSPILEAGLVVRERGPRGELLLRRAPGSNPQSLLHALVASLRSGGIEQGVVESGLRGGWTSPHLDDGKKEVVAARLTPMLCLANPAGCDTVRMEGWDGVLRALEALEFGSSGEPVQRPPRTYREMALPTPVQPSVIAVSLTAFQYAGSAIAAGDFNGDGNGDFVITGYGHCAFLVFFFSLSLLSLSLSLQCGLKPGVVVGAVSTSSFFAPTLTLLSTHYDHTTHTHTQPPMVYTWTMPWV